MAPPDSTSGPPPATLAQMCYEVAYFALPQYVFQAFSRLEELWEEMPEAAGPFFYLLVAHVRGVEPVREDGLRFRWHHGGLTDRLTYAVLEYPAPPAVDFGNPAWDMVLAPHFSAVVRGEGELHYFVLGQSPGILEESDPWSSGTTLRCVTADGANCNLGPGPEPELSAFLDAVRRRLERRGGRS